MFLVVLVSGLEQKDMSRLQSSSCLYAAVQSLIVGTGKIVRALNIEEIGVSVRSKAECSCSIM